jgi:hypothetical protein
MSYQPSFTWPIIPPPHSTKGQLFTAKLPSGKPHQALDMGTGGNMVHAPAGGTVTVSSKTHDSRGRILYIDHGNGWVTRYYHLDSALVKRGDEVKQGQEIAVVGRSGLPKNNPHLHFMVIRDGAPIDPQTVLPAMAGFGTVEHDPFRLLPSDYFFAKPVGPGTFTIYEGGLRRRPRKTVFVGFGEEMFQLMQVSINPDFIKSIVFPEDEEEEASEDTDDILSEELVAAEEIDYIDYVDYVDSDSTWLWAVAAVGAVWAWKKLR